MQAKEATPLPGQSPDEVGPLGVGPSPPRGVGLERVGAQGQVGLLSGQEMVFGSP